MTRPATADFIIEDTTLITMNSARDVLTQAALAVTDGRISWIGPTREAVQIETEKRIDGSNRILTPGFINTHVHITGDYLTRHYEPDNLDDDARLLNWVIPRYHAHSPEDERLSALHGGLSLLKGGTTTFLEAGTVRHLDCIVDGLRQVGIRARIGNWIEGRAFDPSEDETALIDSAIKVMEEQVARYPEQGDNLIAAWPILVGHNTNPDAVWQAAKQIAKAAGVGIAAHMSPYDTDPKWYLANTRRRPLIHLAHLGVLDDATMITHATYLDEAECDVLADTRANISFCPLATLKGGFGAAKFSQYAALYRRGVNISFATDNYEPEILQAARIGVGVIKDLDATVVHIAAADGLAAITIGAAQALGLDQDIGSLEVGKSADMVSFDTRMPQWRPLISPIDQLIWGADGRSIDRVWVAGKQRIEGGRSVDIDEEALLEQVDAASKSVLARAGLPFQRDWAMRPA